MTKRILRQEFKKLEKSLKNIQKLEYKVCLKPFYIKGKLNKNRSQHLKKGKVLKQVQKKQNHETT